jgi:general secretion pathway protein H
MPISAAGNKRSLAMHAAERGFTLVELMIVITIIGLASAVAVWVMPDPHGRVTDEAARFAMRTRAAHDEAIVNARPVSVWVSAAGYGFDQRLAGNWLPMSEKPLRVSQWTEGTRAAVPDISGRVRVTFDPTGLADRPLDLRLQRRGSTATVRIAADGSVVVDA